MNDRFQFRRFLVRQDQCAMKVGTDGVLLGAWATAAVNEGLSVLDIGTGTGLVALMMAQRFDKAHVVGVELEHNAAMQAMENAANSEFADRITVVEAPLQSFSTDSKFDTIVCNPPFFTHSLQCPDEQRTMARHANTLNSHDLMTCSAALLAQGGELSVIIPCEAKDSYDYEASMAGLFISRICWVRTKSDGAPKRVLLAYSNTVPNGLDTSHLVIGDDKYQAMTRDFYLK